MTNIHICNFKLSYAHTQSRYWSTYIDDDQVHWNIKTNVCLCKCVPIYTRYTKTNSSDVSFEHRSLVPTWYYQGTYLFIQITKYNLLISLLIKLTKKKLIIIIYILKWPSKLTKLNCKCKKCLVVMAKVYSIFMESSKYALCVVNM